MKSVIWYCAGQTLISLFILYVMWQHNNKVDFTTDQIQTNEVEIINVNLGIDLILKELREYHPEEYNKSGE